MERNRETQEYLLNHVPGRCFLIQTEASIDSRKTMLQLSQEEFAVYEITICDFTLGRTPQGDALCFHRTGC